MQPTNRDPHPLRAAVRGKLWVMALGLTVGAIVFAAGHSSGDAASQDGLRPMLAFGLGFLSLFAGIASLWSP